MVAEVVVVVVVVVVVGVSLLRFGGKARPFNRRSATVFPLAYHGLAKSESGNVGLSLATVRALADRAASHGTGGRAGGGSRRAPHAVPAPQPLPAPG